MRYYKYVDGRYPSFTKGKIYPEGSYGDNNTSTMPVEKYCELDYKSTFFGHFIVVPEKEYLIQEGMYEEDFVLPEKWCIKVTGENIEILYEWVKSHKDISSSYLDVPVRDWVISDRYDGSYQKWSSTRPSEYKEITFEQFKKYVLNMKEENQLPKYWFIKNDYPEVREYLTKKYGQNFNAWKNYSYIGCDGAIKNNGVHAGPKHCFYNDAIEITIKEFRKYTNNLNEEKVNKNIIGYKLIKSEYKQAVNKICGVADFDFKRLEILENIEGAVNKLKEAGVLDLWFEPVYEEEFKVGDLVFIEDTDSGAKGVIGEIGKITNELSTDGCGHGIKVKIFNRVWQIGDKDVKLRKATPEEIKKLQIPDITINGYKAEFFDTYVKFGCAQMSKEVFIDLSTINEYNNTNREIESVTIGAGTFSKEVIKQIVEYYKNREE